MEQVRGRQYIHQRSLERDFLASASGKFAPSRQSLHPGIETLRFGKIDMRDGPKKPLQELSLSWPLQRFEGVDKQVEKSIFSR